MNRVVVTGMGAVSPLGNTLEDSWEALKAGRSGIGPITRFDASGLQWKTAGELDGFDPLDHVSPKDELRFDPFVLYAAAAARMAVGDAELCEFPQASGVIVGSSRGGIGTLERCINGRPSAYLMPGTTVSMAASYVSGILGTRGHVLGISNACSSGSCAVGEAFRMIRHGLAEVMVAGGAEAPVCGVCIKGYGTLGALSRQGISRPFDRERDGFVIAEGAAIMVLEDYQHAIERGAGVYGEITGYGNTSGDYHQTVPSSAGQAGAIGAALAESAIKPSDVDYISAHATSTHVGDMAEAETINRVFGTRRVPLSAVKSMTGHMLGASGALEAVFALKGISEGIVPPTINLKEPVFGLGHVTEPREAPIRHAIASSFGFGGVNSVLVFKA
jgi:3-oxoacyl-[acyl-carrier-protein] synthase II